jgi:hypothetical protein
MYQGIKFHVHQEKAHGSQDIEWSVWYSYVQFDLWTSKSIEVIYKLRCTSIQNLMSNKQRNTCIKILSGQYFLMSIMTLELWRIRVNPFFQMYTVQSLMSVKEWVLKTLTAQYIHVSSLTLDLKIILEIISWCTSLQSLKSVKQRVLKILNTYYIHMSSSNLWSFHLKINDGHLLFMM